MTTETMTLPPDVGAQHPTVETDFIRRQSFYNNFGELQLKSLRGGLDLNSLEDRELLMALYSDWVCQDVGVFLECVLDGKTTYHWLKGSKRGNDVDMRNVEKKLKNVGMNIGPFADYDQTRALKGVSTVDPQMFGNDLNLAFEVLGKEFNRFTSALRKRYGKVQIFRAWECHESGFWHIHWIICFENKRWLVVGRDKKGKWRIPYEMKTDIEGLWGLGFLEIQAVVPDSVSDDIEDTVWYITKSRKEGDYRNIKSWSRKRLLTLSIMWYLGKRSWSCSKALRGSAYLMDDTELIKTRFEMNCIFGIQKVPKWTFIGMANRADTDIESDEWEKIYTGLGNWINTVWVPGCFSDEKKLHFQKLIDRSQEIYLRDLYRDGRGVSKYGK